MHSKVAASDFSISASYVDEVFETEGDTQGEHGPNDAQGEHAPRNARKLAALEELLRSYGSIAIGFSGGVDSTFLATVAARALPRDRVLLIHVDSPFVGTPEQSSFEREAGRLGLPLARIAVDPLSVPAVAANPHDRCYHCKQAVFSTIIAEAQRRGIAVVADGSNASDVGDYRPGMRAVEEMGVRSPLMETGWDKAEERELLRAWGCAVWDLPAGACMATRVPCGEQLTTEKLDTIRACEDYLHERGLKQVRVRLDNGVARVSAAREDLALLAQQTAGAAEGSIALSDDIIQALMARGARRVEPTATLYQHGEMSHPTA